MKMYTEEQMWRMCKFGYAQYDDLDKNYDPSEVTAKMEELRQLFQDRLRYLEEKK